MVIATRSTSPSCPRILSRVTPGVVIAERFEIEGDARSGAMGLVYRARDRATSGPVALKFLHADKTDEAPRFEREALALAALGQDRIPGVVGYIDHGVTSAGERYLAMEWLSGETLAERLA